MLIAAVIGCVLLVVAHLGFRRMQGNMAQEL
jgi:hypothetical protein